MAWDYAAGGGCFSTRGNDASMQAQRGALDVQIVIAGLARFGSSKVPTRTKIKWGRASASLKSGVPQFAQNRRCIRLPLSAALEKSLVFPTTLNAAVRKQAPTVPLPAPKYWQSRHQHTRVTMGGSGLSHLTAPHRHPPVTVIALSKVKEGRIADRTPVLPAFISAMPSNPSLPPTCYSRLHPLPHAGELKRSSHREPRWHLPLFHLAGDRGHPRLVPAQVRRAML
jgi:hypothetical protein